MTGPLITDLPLWERHEQRVLAVMRTALRGLGEKSAGGDEGRLNRLLYMCILKAIRELAMSGGFAFDTPPGMKPRTHPHHRPKARRANGRYPTCPGATSTARSRMNSAPCAASPLNASVLGLRPVEEETSTSSTSATVCNALSIRTGGTETTSPQAQWLDMWSHSQRRRSLRRSTEH